MAETVNTNQFKNGMHIELDGQPWRIVEFQHVKPGKGGAFVRTKLKGLASGAVVDRTFRAGEKFSRVHTETKSVQYLYDDGSEVHFMDSDTYEQFALAHSDVEDELPFMQPNATVQVLAVDGKPSSVQLPASVELSVVETEPGVKGDTVSNVTKPATLETGAVVQVPLFVNVGDRLRSTRTRSATSAGRRLSSLCTGGPRCWSPTSGSGSCSASSSEEARSCSSSSPSGAGCGSVSRSSGAGPTARARRC